MTAPNPLFAAIDTLHAAFVGAPSADAGDPADFVAPVVVDVEPSAQRVPSTLAEHVVSTVCEQLVDGVAMLSHVSAAIREQLSVGSVAALGMLNDAAKSQLVEIDGSSVSLTDDGEKLALDAGWLDELLVDVVEVPEGLAQIVEIVAVVEDVVEAPELLVDAGAFALLTHYRTAKATIEKVKSIDDDDFLAAIYATERDTKNRSTILLAIEDRREALSIVVEPYAPEPDEQEVAPPCADGEHVWVDCANVEDGPCAPYCSICFADYMPPASVEPVANVIGGPVEAAQRDAAAYIADPTVFDSDERIIEIPAPVAAPTLVEAKSLAEEFLVRHAMGIDETSVFGSTLARLVLQLSDAPVASKRSSSKRSSKTSEPVEGAVDAHELALGTFALSPSGLVVLIASRNERLTSIRTLQADGSWKSAGYRRPKSTFVVPFDDATSAGVSDESLSQLSSRLRELL